MLNNKDFLAALQWFSPYTQSIYPIYFKISDLHLSDFKRIVYNFYFLASLIFGKSKVLLDSYFRFIELEEKKLHYMCV